MSVATKNTGSNNTGSNNTGSNNTGSNNTGSKNTASKNTASNNTGSNNTGSNNTASNNTGSKNTGSKNTGSKNTQDTRDGFVTGTINDDLIIPGYVDADGDEIDNNDAILPGENGDDDIVLAGGGNDTVMSGDGDDEVYAGSGSDEVSGGAGDDIIYGDSAYSGPNPGPSVRESFEWDKAGSDDGDPLGGFTQNTGSVDVSFSIVQQSGAATTEFSDDKQNVEDIEDDGENVDYKSSLSNILNGHGNSADYCLDFSTPVEAVSFRINDIDGDGIVRVKAFDAHGNPIVVNLEGGSRLTLKDTDGVAGNDTADSKGGYLPDNSDEYSLLVSIPGPVAKIVIEHDQDGGNNSGINVTDVYFDVPFVDDGAPGDDLLKGDDGDDTIFGDDGNDTLRGGDDNDSLDGGDGHDKVYGDAGDDVLKGGAGNDTLSGGADADTIFGGAGDKVDGGAGGFNANPALNTDLDVLDLTGQGPFFLDNVTPDSNGNGINGTVIFVDGAGNPNGLTLSFTEIEEVIGDEINRAPDAVNDAITIGEDDGATVIDLTGNDTDPDGDDVEITSVDTTGTIGDVTINPDNDSVTYDAGDAFNYLAAGETATDTFTYDVDDGKGGSDTATVTVTITGENDDPTANDDTATTPFNTAVEIDVLANDTDPDSTDVLRVTNATSPNGSVVITPAGKLLFTPTPGFEGPATINYDITDDNGGTSSATVTVTVEDQPLDGIVSGTDAGELIDEDYVGDPQGDKVDNNDEILPGEGPNDDIIQAGGGDDTIKAGEGDDDVFAGTGDDSVDGGTGDDILRGEQGEDTLNGGAGDDTIEGGDDDDVITGGKGSDSILGGDGDDLITSSDPANDLRIDKGYPGLFTGEEGTPAAENERDFVDGGAGNDTISTGDDRDTIVGGTGDDVIDGGIDDDEITGDDGADRIVGGEGNDAIDGGVGNDTIYAGNDPVLGLDNLNIEDDGSNPFGPDLRPDNGRDTVFGGEGDDLIYGADDDDDLFGEEGNDTIFGEIDDDLIDGGTGDDSLSGGQGDDTIEGGDGQDVIDGGIGNDVLSGGADQDLFVNVNAGDVIDGGAGGFNADPALNTDSDTLDLTGAKPVGGSQDIIFTNPDADGNGFDGVVNFFDSDGNAAGSLTFTDIEDVIPCFTPGTMIATPTGERLVQDLKVGDRVITRDNGIQEIRWVGRRDMTGQELAVAEHLRPVLIQKGALGKGLPERDMLVSPQHRVLMSSDKTELYFDEAEVLVAAKHLTDMDGIDVVEISQTTYIHVMFDQHEVILSDGAWTESFQPGDQTLASMGDAQRAEILELFPELGTVVGIEGYIAARRSLKKHEAKLLTMQ